MCGKLCIFKTKISRQHTRTASMVSHLTWKVRFKDRRPFMGPPNGAVKQYKIGFKAKERKCDDSSICLS